MVSIISYNKQTWKEYNDNQTAHENLAKGAIISADRLNHMEDGISNNDTNKVNVSDMRKPASDVAGIEEVNAKQDKIGYTPSDDSKVVHNSGTEEIAGQKTYDIAPIDKTSGKPYITKDGVPKVDLSNYATNSQLATKADDSAVVHSKDMRKPARDVAGIDEVSTLQTQVDNSAVGTNLIVQSDLKMGYIIRDNGGVFGYSPVDFHSDNYIATNGATVFTISSPDYVFKGNINDTLAMYDSNKKYLGYQDITSATQTLSKPNAVYIRLSINFVAEGGTSNNLSDWLDNHRYKLEKGSVATDWCPNPEDKVNVADMRKPASDVAGIEEVNTKQDKIAYTPADDSKVAHLSGANNFDTIPTVNNNPLLLASSLPSDLARTGSNQEFTGKNTFDTAPIDKTTGNPYITKSDIPKDAVIKVVTQAEYNKLTDKTGLYVIQG